MKMKKITLILALLGLVVSGSAVAAGDVAAGKAKSAQCAACHGLAGVSPMAIYPNLAGQKEAYLAKQISDFRSGVRKDPTMNAMVAALTDADTANLAAYYAGLK